MEGNAKTSEPLTAAGTIQNNDNLIFECLELGNSICCLLMNDNCLKEQSRTEPTCLIDNLSMQNRNLELLHEILRKIRINLFEGGK